jgi:hypothetical protein
MIRKTYHRHSLTLTNYSILRKNVSETIWSETEKIVADRAFKKAYDCEITTLMHTIRQKTTEISEVSDLWRLHDFLSAKRHQIDGKYDHRDGVLIFVFAQLVQEGWLQVEDLDGLTTDKLSKISVLARVGF